MTYLDSTPAPLAEKINHKDGISYGALAFALAFLALPLYMVLPNYYSKNLQLSLSVVGLILLLTRLVDALWDPILGLLIDRWYLQSKTALMRKVIAAACLMSLSFAVLLQPQKLMQYFNFGSLEFWIILALLVCYACFSFITITHQAWAVLLGNGHIQQSQVASYREAIALLGVLVASVLSNLYGLWLNWWVFTFSLAIGVAAWYFLFLRQQSFISIPQSPQVVIAWNWRDVLQQLSQPFKDGVFKQLLLVYAVNGVASAIAATLFLFFVQDKLQLSTIQASILLLLYFVSAAISMPVWLNCIKHWGLKKSWLLAMLIAVVSFVGSYFLSSGDMLAFALICVFTGFALGADLTAPMAMLNTHIQNSANGLEMKAQYLSWWNFVTKLNLALAAGLALPLLAVLSYVPVPAGTTASHSEQALVALSIAYAVVPCLLKIIAMVLLIKNKSLQAIS